MPVLPAEITRNNPSDTYALLDELVLRGGFKSVADTTERDNLSTDVRSEGMLVYLTGSNTWYQLQGGITNGDWVQITFGGGGFDGNPSSLNQEGATLGEAIIWDGSQWTPKPVLDNTTGVITGGEVTVNGGDNTKFDVAAGTGWIIDWTDPTQPTKTYITWPTFLAQDLPNIGSTLFTAVAIEESPTPNVGQLVIQNSLHTPEQRRQWISLQTVVHTNFTSITSIATSSQPAYEITEALLDYVLELGALNEGNQFTANGANLNIDKEAGQTTLPFINRSVNPQNPTQKTDPAVTGATFTRYYRDGVGGYTVVAGQTEIDPDNYDDGSGTLASVPNNRYQVKRFYFFGVTETEAITYGQEVYATLEAAKTGIFTENPDIAPVLSGGVFVTALIVKEGVTDLQAAIIAGDAEFVPITSETSGSTGSVQDLQSVLEAGSVGELINVVTSITNAEVSATGASSSIELQTYGAGLIGFADRSLGFGGDYSLIQSGATDVITTAVDGSNSSRITVKPSSIELELPFGIAANYKALDESSITYSNTYDIVSRRFVDGTKKSMSSSANAFPSDFSRRYNEIVNTTVNSYTLTLPVTLLGQIQDGSSLEVNLYNSTGSITLDASAVTLVDSEGVLINPRNAIDVKAVVILFDDATSTFKIIGKYTP